MHTQTPDTQNTELQLAQDFIQHTCRNLFLTGKAGTGKTTFLHNLKHHTSKRMIITAPTGVAAINAGGVTLHSFFQLPFGPCIPGSDMAPRRFSKEKISIIKSLDLLVIDEISMVRADLLDGVDAVLRRYKHRHRPFGGVQLLMIGDLHQLAPVIRDDEWQLLRPYYDSCYFFSSTALKQTDMISIELKRVYRQSDADFIELLNRVRDNRLDTATLQTLNSRHLPDFQISSDENYITLTTHNRNADQINDRQLQALPSGSFSFQASIEGDYPEYSHPTAEKLILKKGAQVMFVRNDSAAEKRYFNGKIGKIIHIDQEQIIVKCPGDDQEIRIEPVSWENIKYSLDEKTGDISENVIGRFTQFPLRLAWAITIHKSQGLTFERAIIDAQSAFSHGQVYVALSRCKTFDGMILSTPIAQDAIKTDSTVAQFAASASQRPPTQEQLHNAKIHYQQQLLLECFDYQPLASSLRNLLKALRDNGHLIHVTATESMDVMEKQARDSLFIVADKFRRQLQSLFAHNTMPEDDAQIQQRIQKASVYFTDKLQSGLIRWLAGFSLDTDNRETKKNISKAFESLQHLVAIKTAALQSCREGFITSAFLNAVARAEIDFSTQSPASRKQPAETGTANARHPELLQTLKTWRANQAEKEQVAHYRILHQRVLLQIVMQLPGTLNALSQISGVGKATTEKYGTQITGIVSDYCRQQNMQPPQIPAGHINEDFS